MRKRICNLVEQIARRSKWNTGFRVIAVLTYGGKILSVGYNRFQPKPHRNVHAERSAIRAVKNARECDLYVLRLGEKKRPSMCRPCRDCMQMIVDHNIRDVFYTNYDGKWESLF